MSSDLRVKNTWPKRVWGPKITLFTDIPRHANFILKLFTLNSDGAEHMIFFINIDGTSVAQYLIYASECLIVFWWNDKSLNDPE